MSRLNQTVAVLAQLLFVAAVTGGMIMAIAPTIA